jgi:hypothetical protein
MPEAVSLGPQDRFAPVLGTGLSEDAIDVGFDGVRAQVEGSGNVAIGEAASNEDENLALSSGEMVWQRRRRLVNA